MYYIIRKLYLQGGFFMKKAIAILLSLFMILGVWGVVPWVLAQTPDLSTLTTFVFNGNTLTVTEGTDTKYEVTVYASDTTETAPTTVTSGGSTLYSIPSGAKGELRVVIKKSGGSYLFSGNGTGHIAVKK